MDTETERWTIRVVLDAAAMGAAAADVVAEVVREKREAVISVPTGSTPLTMFDVLAARAARGEIDLSRIELFCLDEYLGVDANDPNSLTRWLFEALIDRAGIDPGRVHALPSAAPDPVAAAAAFERELETRGGLDLAVLGLGPNGHVAYNEPGATADSRTRVVDLTPESIAQASAYWQDTVPIPSQAMTMGVGTLLGAKRLVLIVTGAAKAGILKQALEAPMSADVPASWLRLAGPRLETIVDEAAAGELDRSMTARQAP